MGAARRSERYKELSAVLAQNVSIASGFSLRGLSSYQGGSEVARWSGRVYGDGKGRRGGWPSFDVILLDRFNKEAEGQDAASYGVR